MYMGLMIPTICAEGGGPPAGTVRALAIDPSTPSTLDAGTFWGGVFKSTDGGTSWTNISGPTTPYVYGLSVNALAIDPFTPDTLFAGTDGRVFRSTNGGTSWAAVARITARAFVYAPAIDPSTPATVYAGTVGKGVFKSTDGGGSWHPTGANYADGTPPESPPSP